MPRVAGQPSGRTRPAARQIATTPHKQSPMKLTLNDDRGEKAARLQSRQALQEIHMNEIRAAASPMRKINQNTHARAASQSPQTPRTQAAGGAAIVAKRRISRGGTRLSSGSYNNPGSPGQLNVVSSTAITPMKRVPILANFEEWMKMATDNKINAANSWNFALIDYFHDMSLLKEGDGVNFQKASCTLDGCVKIYTSRVDSVATETGRLLSGLADSAEGKGKKSREGGDGEDDEEEEDEDEEGEDGAKKKTKKKASRSHEATLAPSFASLQLKKLELEFAVDPLFKKATADFDEGGAKGLLLNHLSIDSSGRIVFDSSDDAGDTDSTNQLRRQSTGVNELQVVVSQDLQEDDDEEIDLSQLASKFFPDLSILDTQDICPSMKDFTLGSADLTIPSLKIPNDSRDADKKKKDSLSEQLLDPNLNLADQTGIFIDGSNAIGFDDDDDDDGGLMGGFDMPDNVGFGEGGEAWAKDAALEQMMKVVSADDANGPLDDNLIEGNNADTYALSLDHRYREDTEHESIMAYFDKAFNSRAKVGSAGFMTLENWRIQKIQKARQSEAATTARPRKEKEHFEIDFLGPMSDSLRDLLEAPPVANSTISLPKGQWKTKGRNLLDKDDEVIDARKLMRLWTKPKCRVGRRKGEMRVIDEGFGARGQNAGTNNLNEDDDDEGRKGDYDANFFADDEPILPFDIPLPIDDDDDDEDNNQPLDDNQGFMDAREMLSPQPDRNTEGLNGIDDGIIGFDDQNPPPPPDSQFPPSSQIDLLPGSFGSQLVTQTGRRLRPEYVNYARTAKKVDVRKLKENMWKGMSETLMKSMGDLSLSTVPPTIVPEHATTATSPTQDEDGDTDMMDMDSADTPSTPEDPAQPLTPPPPALRFETAAGDGGLGGEEGTELKFTSMIGDLRKVYPEQQMKDISTSYCFICLLHLANEKGLVLEGDREGEGAMMEIKVRRDLSVGEGYEGE